MVFTASRRQPAAVWKLTLNGTRGVQWTPVHLCVAVTTVPQTSDLLPYMTLSVHLFVIHAWHQVVDVELSLEIFTEIPLGSIGPQSSLHLHNWLHSAISLTQTIITWCKLRLHQRTTTDKLAAVRGMWQVYVAQLPKVIMPRHRSRRHEAAAASHISSSRRQSHLCD